MGVRIVRPHTWPPSSWQRMMPPQSQLWPVGGEKVVLLWNMGRICYDIHIYSQYSWHILGIFTSYFRHILAYSRKSSKKYWIYIFSHIGAYSKIFNIPPPQNRMCPNMPRIPIQIRRRIWEQNFTLFEKIHSFSYSLHIHLVLVWYWWYIVTIFKNLQILNILLFSLAYSI